MELRGDRARETERQGEEGREKREKGEGAGPYRGNSNLPGKLKVQKRERQSESDVATGQYRRSRKKGREEIRGRKRNGEKERCGVERLAKKQRNSTLPVLASRSKKTGRLFELVRLPSK